MPTLPSLRGSLRAASAFVAALALVVALPHGAFAAPGDLDATFGTGGKVTVDGAFSDGQDLAVQADGRIVTVGARQDPDTFYADFSVMRHNSDGSVDTTFGGGDGEVLTDFEQGEDRAQGVTLQPDGKIVVVGRTQRTADEFAGCCWLTVARYNTDGSLDTTFGGTGWAVPNWPAAPRRAGRSRCSPMGGSSPRARQAARSRRCATTPTAPWTPPSTVTARSSPRSRTWAARRGSTWPCSPTGSSSSSATRARPPSTSRWPATTPTAASTRPSAATAGSPRTSAATTGAGPWPSSRPARSSPPGRPAATSRSSATTSTALSTTASAPEASSPPPSAPPPVWKPSCSSPTTGSSPRAPPPG